MARVTVTSKGQITIPVEIRRALGLRDGDQLDIVLEQDGTSRLTKLHPVSELFGMLGRPPKNADAKVIRTPYRDLEV